MKTRMMCRLVIVIGCVFHATVAWGGAPPPNWKTPGKVLGQTYSHWVAPWVLFSCTQMGRCGDDYFSSVRWMSEDGTIIHRLDDVNPEKGYFSRRGENGQIIYGLFGDWTIELPRPDPPESSGFVNCTPDGRTFIYVHDYLEGPRGIDIYFKGELISSLGPFEQLSRHVTLGDDGSISFFVTRPDDSYLVDLILVNSLGEEVFRVVCDPDARVMACHNLGVLVDEPTGSYGYFYGAESSTKIDVGRPYLLTWIDGTHEAILSTAIGHDHTLHYVDMSLGNIRWAAPGADTELTSSVPPVAVLDEFVLVSSCEPSEREKKAGHILSPARRIVALDIHTGERVAFWTQAGRSMVYPLTAGEFFRHNDRLYYVAGDVFCEILLEDIVQKGHGWK